MAMLMNNPFVLIGIMSLVLFSALVFSLETSHITISVSSLSFNSWNVTTQNFTLTLRPDKSIASIVVNNSTTLKNSRLEEMNVIVSNATGINTTDFFLDNSSLNSTNVTLYPDMYSRPAGRYIGNITITSNSTNSDHSTVNIPITVDVLLSAGPFYGNTTNSSSTPFYFNITSSNIAGLNINLTNLNENVTIALKNPAGSIVKQITTPENLTYTFATNTTNWAANIGEIWSFEITGNSSNNVGFDGDLSLLPATFVVNNSINTSTISFVKNLGQNPNVTIYINISNYGLNNTTVISVTNSSGKLYHSTNNSKTFDLTTNISSTPFNLTPESTTTFQINITSPSERIKGDEGDYYGWILFNTSNGYPNTIFNLTLKMTVTNELNITIINVSKHGDPSNNYPTPNDNINVTLDIRYKDGTSYDFGNTAYIDRIIWMNHSVNGAYSRIANNYLDPSGFLSPISLYFNITNTTAGGNYTLYVRINDSNKNNTGTVSYNYLKLNESAIRLGLVVEAPGSLDGSVNEVRYVTLKVANIGYRNASAVVIDKSISGCTAAQYNSSLPILSSGIDINASQEIQIPSLWKVTLSSQGVCSMTAFGKSINGNAANSYLFVLNNTISGQVLGSSSTNNQSSDSGGSASPTPWLIFTSYPTSIDVRRGENYTAVIRIKNIGNLSALGVKLWVTGIDSSWWIQPPAKDILADGVEQSFAVTFVIPRTAAIGDYAITFVANRTGVSASKSSILHVLPEETTINQTENVTREELSISISNYTDIYNNLSKLVQQLKNMGYNVSDVESLLNESIVLIDQAQAYMTLGNYTNAANVLKDVSQKLIQATSKLNDIKASLDKSRAESMTNILMLVGVVVAIIILIYLFLPRKSGYISGVGFRHAPYKTKAHEIVHKIKEKLKRKKHEKGKYQYRPAG